MSEPARTQRSLVEWIGLLLGALSDGDRAAYGRLLAIVTGYSARIGLDDEWALVSARRGEIVVTAATDEAADGDGSTTRSVVEALLDADLELATAILDGHIEIRGSDEAVSRMLLAIEILLDAAARVPELQRIGREYRESGPRRPAPDLTARSDWYPRAPGPGEEALLARLGLLPRHGQG
jgi:hypothetical protein